MTVGEKIRKLRRERAWTQKELGERAGIDGKNISSYENGRLQPSGKTLQRFAHALGLSADELLSDSTQQPVLALEDPELLHLFREVASLPEADRTKLKWVLSLAIKQNRIQQTIAS